MVGCTNLDPGFLLRVFNSLRQWQIHNTRQITCKIYILCIDVGLLQASQTKMYDWILDCNMTQIDRTLLIIYDETAWPSGWYGKSSTRGYLLVSIFMTLIPDLTFTDLLVISVEHLKRVWLTSRERLPLLDTWFCPPFGDLLLFQLLRPVLAKCRIFSRLFTLNTPRYFLDFAQYEDWFSIAHMR